tara:strand:+ start:22191 stop:23906 length:1716 start_codon:yes stop_codon:yes gene_type:complete
MGIKHFFIWFKKTFNHNIHKLSQNVKVNDLDVSLDVLMIDMNGILHNSAQKIYEYGNYKLQPRLIQKKKNINNLQLQINLFIDVCKNIEDLVNITNPSKKIILCIDGPAPLSKQSQQRQRRFRSSQENSNENGFDSNCITPGTKFMDYLSKYIDWFLKKKINEDPKWQNLEIILSNEKVPGEGEHKIINYMRSYGDKKETYCLYGLDADLIMLSLGTHYPNFYILREDMYDVNNEYFLIDIGKVHKDLETLLYWENKENDYNPEYAINDFIFLCFLVGNDFLPQIPSIEILEDGIELIISIYKEIGYSCGHITNKIGTNIRFNPRNLKIFLKTISFYEKQNLEAKMKKKQSFFKDNVLERSSTFINDSWNVNIDAYKNNYMCSKFGANLSEKDISLDYIEGLQWVLSYYIKGVPDWKWSYNYSYAPPASIIANYVDFYVYKPYKSTFPTTPFQQLLCVLPPKSSNLIPHPLCDLLTKEESPIKSYYPTSFDIDLSGKRKEWEGIVILPIINFELVREIYFKIINCVNIIDLKRNVTGKSFIYKFDTKVSYNFKSFYGDISDCKTNTTIINF